MTSTNLIPQRSLLSVLSVAFLFAASSRVAAVTFFDNEAAFNAAVAALNFEGTEDWESSTLAPNNILNFQDPLLAPGVPNGPFPTGTNVATGLTVQSNTLGGMPVNPSPGGAFSLATASAGFLGTPTDQVSNNNIGDSFDMLFGLTDTAAVSFIPLIFDLAASGDAGTATIRVFDSSNALLGSAVDIAVAGFMNPTSFVGVVAMAGEDIGRINVFATSTDDLFSGADDIDVYTAATQPPGGNDVPEPVTAALGMMGLAALGAATKRRCVA